MKKFKETRGVTNIERPAHYSFARSAENIAIISESVAEGTNVWILHRSQELGLCILWRILCLDLHLHPYKLQLTQQL